MMEKELQDMSLEELWELFPIVLKEHNAQYKQWYQIEKTAIIDSVGHRYVQRINHIGSTAVERLIAKPTVDILLEIDENCNVEQLKGTLSASGWILMSFEENPVLKMVFNKGYTRRGYAEKVFHLHVRHSGDWDELYFRDYLLAHSEIAQAYGELKQTLKAYFEHDRDWYTKGKTEFIVQYSQIAKAEFLDRYNPLSKIDTK